MARRPSPVREPQKAQLTSEQMKRGIRRLELRIREVEEFDPTTVRTDEDTATAEALAASVEGALVETFGPDTVEYRRFSDAAMFNWPINLVYGTPTHEIQDSLRRCRSRSLALLRQAISFLKEESEDIGPAPSPQSRGAAIESSSRKVFVVHGRDGEAKNEVARFLERVGLDTVVLHERANLGRHLLTKFQQEAGEAAFAVVLITPDDEGCLIGGSPRQRARQNVVFELGFFIGKLGSERVVALVKGDVEKPSDYDGIGYVTLDSSGGWKGLLARELAAVGIPFDHSRVFSA